MASLTNVNEAGFPPGVMNILVDDIMSSHMDIEKLSFLIMERVAQTNLKDFTLELRDKSSSIIFNDADLDLAVDSSSHGIFLNHGQACCPVSRILVQSGIYDESQEAYREGGHSMSYIESGKSEGTTVQLGSIEPTIFTNTAVNIRIVQQDIFVPVGVVIKFEDKTEVLRQPNDSLYGMVALVFRRNISRGLGSAHKLKAGMARITRANQIYLTDLIRLGFL
ncbi:ALDH-like protein [Stereum hirsutum FP-91666 SS1]|uniref:ALDH-like protein n=1 Tax=Stereum hirsutum (strain FP-91666) TaxID=721885 RepID=UPI000444A825|nr:ALDH-like protein [Stereum hirsutum FP-91666 SS1]EIM83629.1 ALDH-like protein [Stereum hirsutum FP-91666 SS1]